jgi:hypothetical protein
MFTDQGVALTYLMLPPQRMRIVAMYFFHAAVIAIEKRAVSSKLLASFLFARTQNEQLLSDGFEHVFRD